MVATPLHLKSILEIFAKGGRWASDFFHEKGGVAKIKGCLKKEAITDFHAFHLQPFPRLSFVYLHFLCHFSFCVTGRT